MSSIEGGREKYYTLMPCPRRYHEDEYRLRYINTMYDDLYIGGKWSWMQFHLLVNMFIRLNTTRPLSYQARLDVEMLFRMKNVRVDFNMFVALPLQIWTQFPQLKKLSIVMYSYNDFSQYEEISFGREKGFSELKRQSKHRKRAQWILESARKSFEAIKDDIREWIPPQLDVVLRFADILDDKPIFEDMLKGRFDSEDQNMIMAKTTISAGTSKPRTESFTTYQELRFDV